MELFDFGIPALDKALNLTATVLLLLALGMLLIRVILRLCDRAFDRSEALWWTMTSLVPLVKSYVTSEVCRK